ncbi:hypothetical protein ElyMa_004888800 [Elysia marginata]|uniref:Uncharacterized protein n=1 Tax=Elysia marginata TaxID=1093978 RepID=A0AAV4IVH0_9GAST|nr:hypothetical protein ElyMa_004888800 [Elysia marginata]
MRMKKESIKVRERERETDKGRRRYERNVAWSDLEPARSSYCRPSVNGYPAKSADPDSRFSDGLRASQPVPVLAPEIGGRMNISWNIKT